LYFAEYGAFTPPVEEGEVKQLSGANLSYKRSALERSRDLLEAGVWEAALHERWLTNGEPLWLCRATLIFQGGMPADDALAMRFHYARSYAAGRFRSSSVVRRAIYAAGTVLLPLLMLWRTAREAHAKGRDRRFWRVMPWTLLLDTAWSAGEAVGYLAGAARRPRMY
jgi:hypothetical protein